MKTTILFIALIITSTVFAQTEKNYLLTIGQTHLGAYLEVGGRYSTVMGSEPAGFMDIKGAVVFNGGWAVGLMGSGLYYDKRLSMLVNDGTYHLYVSYGALYAEKLFTLNDNLKISFSIATGQGEAYYQYDKDYQKEKVWSEEIIDKTTFYIFEPSLEIQHRVTGNWWIGLTGSYRNTSPLRIAGATENMLRKFSGGLTLKWGIF